MGLEDVERNLDGMREIIDNMKVELNAEMWRENLDPQTQSELQSELHEVRQDLESLRRKISLAAQ